MNKTIKLINKEFILWDSYCECIRGTYKTMNAVKSALKKYQQHKLKEISVISVREILNGTIKLARYGRNFKWELIRC